MRTPFLSPKQMFWLMGDSSDPAKAARDQWAGAPEEKRRELDELSREVFRAQMRRP